MRYGFIDCNIYSNNELHSKGLARRSPTNHHLRQRKCRQKKRANWQDRKILRLWTKGIRVPPHKQIAGLRQSHRSSQHGLQLPQIFLRQVVLPPSRSLTMNGHTYLRNYRVLMLLGMISFFATAYLSSVPDDYLIEEYTLSYPGELLLLISRTVFRPLPSTRFRTGHLPISQKSTATICMK